MFSRRLLDLAEEVIFTCRAHGVHLATAESCTGGLIAGCLTSVSGASDILNQGFITYANAAKAKLLGVSEELLAQQGAVCEDVARAMAEGALSPDMADIAVAVTGIAGPGGGSKEKPVGLVHIAVAKTGQITQHERHVFKGNRNDVRLQTVEAALKLVLKKMES